MRNYQCICQISVLKQCNFRNDLDLDYNLELEIRKWFRFRNDLEQCRFRKLKNDSGIEGSVMTVVVVERLIRVYSI